jgi:hypothetical protein
LLGRWPERENGSKAAPEGQVTNQFKEVVMKTRVLCIIAAGLLSSGFVFAQSTETLKVTVPFGFQAGSASYPAGDYTVSRVGILPVLKLTSSDLKHVGVVLGRADYTKAKAKTPKLVFNRYAGTHFLCEVWGIAEGGNIMEKTREEREFASRMGRQVEQIMVAASKK